MNLKPFKNKDSNIYKEKIGFIWARIKLTIYDKMKYVGALLWITIYINFKWAVLNIKDVVKN